MSPLLPMRTHPSTPSPLAGEGRGGGDRLWPVRRHPAAHRQHPAGYWHASMEAGRRQGPRSVGRELKPHLAVSNLNVTLDQQGRALPVIDDLSLDIQEGEI